MGDIMRHVISVVYVKLTWHFHGGGYYTHSIYFVFLFEFAICTAIEIPKKVRFFFKSEAQGRSHYDT